MFTKIKVDKHIALALAPLSVLPKVQRQGIGGKLIERGHEIAKGLGYTLCVLLGHPSYYPRFGYITASKFIWIVATRHIEAVVRLQENIVKKPYPASDCGILALMECVLLKPTLQTGLVLYPILRTLRKANLNPLRNRRVKGLLE